MIRVVETVLGPVDADQLGFVQPHEHLSSDSSAQARALHTASDEELRAAGIEPAQRQRLLEPIRMDNLGWIRRYVRNTDNLALDDEDAVVASLAEFRAAGGTAVVDCTSRGIRRNPQALRRISERSGVHVVMGCGWYIADFHPPEVAERAVEELAENMITELEVGVGDPGIKAGVIGEIGTSWPIHPDEEKVLRAAAVAAAATGAGMQVHPGRHPDAPKAALAILGAAGADLSRVSMSHVDRTVTSVPELVRLARSGCYLELDQFGQESTYYPYGDFDVPNDGARITMLRKLLDAGLGERLLISQDLGYKALLPRYGGPGYAHLLHDVVPLMRRRSFTEDEIEQITTHNPVRLLARAAGDGFGAGMSREETA